MVAMGLLWLRTMCYSNYSTLALKVDCDQVNKRFCSKMPKNSKRKDQLEAARKAKQRKVNEWSQEMEQESQMH